jgi:hypothetical protein
VEGVKEMLALGDLTRNVHALSAFFESAVKGEGQRENSRSLVRCLPLRLDRLCLVCFELSLELLDVSLRLGRWDSGDVGFNLDLSSVTGRRWLVQGWNLSRFRTRRERSLGTGWKGLLGRRYFGLAGGLGVSGSNRRSGGRGVRRGAA